MRSADSESSLYSATETSASSTHHSRYKDATLTTICAGDSESVSIKDDTMKIEADDETAVIGQTSLQHKRSFTGDPDPLAPNHTLTVTVQVHAEPTC